MVRIKDKIKVITKQAETVPVTPNSGILRSSRALEPISDVMRMDPESLKENGLFSPARIRKTVAIDESNLTQ